MLKTIVAFAGNRTAVSRVAGENSTTEPTMLILFPIVPAQSHIKYCIHIKKKVCVDGETITSLRHRSREFYH